MTFLLLWWQLIIVTQTDICKTLIKILKVLLLQNFILSVKLQYLKNTMSLEVNLITNWFCFVSFFRTDADFEGHVLSNCSFSKILGPGLRVGWIEAPPRIMKYLDKRYFYYLSYKLHMIECLCCLWKKVHAECYHNYEGCNFFLVKTRIW